MKTPSLPPGSREGGAAAALVASRLSGRQLGELPEEIRPRTVGEGYVVQRLGHAMLEAAGFGRQDGRKIGCTTPVMQAYLGIGSPAAGAMFRVNMWHRHHSFAIAPPWALGVECEIAVRIDHDLVRRDRDYSTGDVADAVSAVMAAIEVVEDRYLDYRALDTPTLIADDFFHYGCVLAPEVEDFDLGELDEVSASMTINEIEVGRGRGKDILGDPLIGLAWLANNCLSCGTYLRAGDIVLLGSLVQTQWVAAGDVVAVRNDMLGGVVASFAPIAQNGGNWHPCGEGAGNKMIRQAPR